MMKLGTYAGLSFLGAIAAIYHAFSSREQFYPAMVYLSTSKICLVLLMNMGLVIMCIIWQLVKCLFLGSLREAEVERLNEQSWREVMEILFAITTFRQDFSVGFLGMVTALLLIKALHWLAQKRVEYIETTPTVSILSHIRIVSFMGFLLLVDCLFLYSSIRPLIQPERHQYMILATTTVSTFVKYTFYVSDMLMEGQWEKKAGVYLLFGTYPRFTSLVHVSFLLYGDLHVPLHLIRELYETFRNFKARIADYLRYRRITSNMNERFPDATPEELNSGDATCIICREEMVTAKKLLCGHLFHVHCLRSWLERQHTCPTCRSLVIPPDNVSHGSGRQQATPSQSHHPGSVAAETSSRGTQNAEKVSLSPHEVRLQAADSAAAVYQKSFSHRPVIRSLNYGLRPKAGNQQQAMELAGEATPSQREHRPPSPPPLLVGTEGLQQQLEALQRQMELLQRQISAVASIPEAKGKVVVGPGSGQLDHGASSC
ncbi:unnamed protein product [Spirodela intermedia]|uniref:RING-type E3 ubiquitin transferase n=1 Tax=Spirodela intermedia TaxID=51605 RepID=A0A7I8IW69_SPIIN|nr:unnamed protein product [Spirodela intermedia]CAA6662237.1 unnamed protein product [Spirodela intermedia]